MGIHGAQPAPGGFYSSTATRLAAPTGGSELAKTEETDVTQMSFLGWLVGLQNRLTAYWQQHDKDERAAFKAQEDAKHMAQKRELHKQIQDDFGNSKLQHELHVAANLAKGNAYKEELEELRQLRAEATEEWMMHGHELTVTHGKEQAERGREAVAECTAEKQEKGKLVKEESQQHEEQINAHRSKAMAEMKKNVSALKREKIGKVEESMQYMYNQKKELVGEVKRVEGKWKRLSEEEQGDFLAHAHENHARNDAGKANMVASRQEWRQKNSDKAWDERRTKEAHTGVISKKRSTAETSKRAIRDVVFSTRFISSEKSKLMRELMHFRNGAPEKAALGIGLLDEVPDKEVTPYRMQGSKNPNHNHLAFEWSPPPSDRATGDTAAIQRKRRSPRTTTEPPLEA